MEKKFEVKIYTRKSSLKEINSQGLSSNSTLRQSFTQTVEKKRLNFRDSTSQTLPRVS
jgi:hypothetical protein